jgi:hypothetical protein
MHVELQQAIEALRQQEREPSIQEPSPQQPLPQQTMSQQPRKEQRYPTQGITDSKCPLADNLQLAPWPP